ncbi:hypothetical protein [Marinobacterium arenosum]|uniref:hypothetical protein n=1 Tax=Marinobacterium arenosum TaxID=2862496 RepID=UPI001C944984|nr:hypothetical protein [Marinobacterium arenosum]MBY4675253.1 hypothetical protein [Marinobacterium arenosum]
MSELYVLTWVIVGWLLAARWHALNIARRRRQQVKQGIEQLALLLELVQLLQRHRGLCLNEAAVGGAEQRSLATQIDQHWRELSGNGYPGDRQRLAQQAHHWQQLRPGHADSFQQHCRLIDQLLHELTVVADNSTLTAMTDQAASRQLWDNLLYRPYYAEALGRIRGLGSLAARTGHCSARLRVQLQYLGRELACYQLADSRSQQVLALLNEQILRPTTIDMEAQRFFAQMSAFIDEQIQLTQGYLVRLKVG